MFQELSVCWVSWKPSSSSIFSGASAGFSVASELSVFQIVLWSEEAYSLSLIFPFDFHLAL